MLKHLSRTGLLLHLVDVVPPDGSDPVADVQAIVRELKKFSDELGARERWLVVNKVDLLPEDERDARVRDIVQRLDWQGPVFAIAALSRQGTEALVFAIMEYLEAQQKSVSEAL